MTQDFELEICVGVKRTRSQSAKVKERKMCAPCGPHLHKPYYDEGPNLDPTNARERIPGNLCWSNGFAAG
jgi:hypothetical protein